MKFLKLFLIVACSMLLLAGCSSSARKVGPFKASYFRESTGELVASETVEWPALRYSSNKFHGVYAHDLYAIWEGPIDFGGEKTGLTVSFNLSWSRVEFSLDGKVVSKWSNDDKKVPLLLEPGRHSIKIEYHTNWPFIGFNASFVNYPALNSDLAKAFLVDKIHASSKIICISSDESGDIYNRAMITLPKTGQPMFLFLYSHRSINWILDNPHNSEIGAVFLSSEGDASTVNNVNDAVPIYALYLSKNSSFEGEVRSITGFSPRYVFGKSSIVDVKIPEI